MYKDHHQDLYEHNLKYNEVDDYKREIKNFYYKKKKKCMVVDKLKFIEELNNVKELTDESPEC